MVVDGMVFTLCAEGIPGCDIRMYQARTLTSCFSSSSPTPVTLFFSFSHSHRAIFFPRLSFFRPLTIAQPALWWYLGTLYRRLMVVCSRKRTMSSFYPYVCIPKTGEEWVAETTSGLAEAAPYLWSRYATFFKTLAKGSVKFVFCSGPASASAINSAAVEHVTLVPVTLRLSLCMVIGSYSVKSMWRRRTFQNFAGMQGFTRYPAKDLFSMVPA